MDGTVVLVLGPLAKADLWILARPGSTTDSNTSTSLSPGAIAGIAVAGAFVAVLAAAGLYFLVRKAYAKKAAETTAKSGSTEGTVIAVAPQEGKEFSEQEEGVVWSS
jgi:hypothetical protein